MLRDSTCAWLLACLSACSAAPEDHGPRILPKPPGSADAGPGSGGAAAMSGTATKDAGSFDSANDKNLTPPPPPPKRDGLSDGACAGKDITTMHVVPTIWLVVDGSGSMTTMLGDSTRWTALRDALMDPSIGVVKSLEHVVNWGFLVYDGRSLGGAAPALPDGGMFSAPTATTCPRVLSLEPKKDNYAAIDAIYSSEPLGGSTPTDKALQAVVAHLPSAGMTMLDAKVNPTIVVLATDGEPNDYCGDNPFRDVKPAVITAVQQLVAANIKTYVISLAGDDQNLTQHLIQVAQAGGTGKPPFVPTNRDQLVETFRQIIGPDAACEFTLVGGVKQGMECMGKLEINGSPLACNDDNGWRLTDAQTITITGTACDAYKADATAVLHAEFPCEVQILK
jgi:von Willebrand factor type A domain